MGAGRPAAALARWIVPARRMSVAKGRAVRVSQRGTSNCTIPLPAEPISQSLVRGWGWGSIGNIALTLPRTSTTLRGNAWKAAARPGAARTTRPQIGSASWSRVSLAITQRVSGSWQIAMSQRSDPSTKPLPNSASGRMPPPAASGAYNPLAVLKTTGPPSP